MKGKGTILSLYVQNMPSWVQGCVKSSEEAWLKSAIWLWKSTIQCSIYKVYYLDKVNLNFNKINTKLMLHARN